MNKELIEKIKNLDLNKESGFLEVLCFFNDFCNKMNEKVFENSGIGKFIFKWQGILFKEIFCEIIVDIKLNNINYSDYSDVFLKFNLKKDSNFGLNMQIIEDDGLINKFIKKCEIEYYMLTNYLNRVDTIYKLEIYSEYFQLIKKINKEL